MFKIRHKYRVCTSYSKQWFSTGIKPIKLNALSALDTFNRNDNVCCSFYGWIYHIRQHKNVTFLTINDGSSGNHVQIVYDTTKLSLPSNIGAGSSVEVVGDLVWLDKGKHPPYEILAQSMNIVGDTSADYPFQKQSYTLEYTRKYPHLRTRTQWFSSMLRLRSAVTQAMHEFMIKELQCYYIHPPTLTPFDCEGAGDLFKIDEPDKDTHFFGKPMYLTEICASGLSKVYSFAPAYRAERSHTSRHLSEFWMLEPEIAYASLNDIIQIIEDLFKYILRFVLDNYVNDLETLHKKSKHSESIMKELETLSTSRIPRISYQTAIEKLQEHGYSNNNNNDLSSENERILAERIYKTPIFITQYPKHIRPFYMKNSNNNNNTVECVDFIVPRVGELAGGSEREYDYDKLLTSMKEHEVNINEYNWYLDLRKYGSVPHAGFGIGLERLLQFISGCSNIRDTTMISRFHTTNSDGNAL